MINIILADDHKIVLDGLVSILDDKDDIKVLGTASDGAQTIQLLKDYQEMIDIAVLDIEMPLMSGIELTKLIMKQYPNVKVLILTMYKTEEFVKQIISAGASGYILKNKGSEELVKAIRYIQTGKSYLGQEITDVLVTALKKKQLSPISIHTHLTKREKEVLRHIVRGRTSRQIGKILSIAPTTVDTHRRNLIDKTGVANSKELISFAIENKIL